MIWGIQVVRPNPPDSLMINLRSSSEDHGLVIFNAEGFGPPQASVSGSPSSFRDGIAYPQVRGEKRVITLTLAVQPGADEVLVKTLIYSYFQTQNPIVLRIYTGPQGLRTYTIHGIVENLEYNQFARTENAVITIVCPDPTFSVGYYSYEQILAGQGVFSEFSIIPPGLIGVSVEYPSSTPYQDGGKDHLEPCGVVFDIMFDGPAEDVTIKNELIGLQGPAPYGNLETQEMRINFSRVTALAAAPQPGGIQAGDWIRVCTIPGFKSINLVRDYVIYNGINGLDLTSQWIQLVPNTTSNKLTFSADTGEANIVFNNNYPTLPGTDPGIMMNYVPLTKGV